MNSSTFRKYWVYTILVALSLLPGSFVTAQNFGNPSGETIGYEKQQYLQEKVYVHTDRNYYLCGDILWFKAYVTRAADHHPLSVSRVVYLELLNAASQPVWQAKVAAKNGSASGSFSVPDTLTSGNYELRAYTNWMKNNSAEFYFKKVITIVNTNRNLDSLITHPVVAHYAGFFPEGGNLINGLSNTVAFKLYDNTGHGLSGEGIIVDQNQDTVAHCKTFLFGMGKFAFIPQSNRQYRAIIRLADGSVIQKELPVGLESGYVMQVKEEGRAVRIAVQYSGVTSQQVSLLIRTRQQVDFARSQRLVNGRALFMVDKDSLKDGMAQITLFDEMERPIDERLFFKRPADKMLIQVTPDQTVYGKRSRVTLALSAQDQTSNPLKGDLSVAVYRLDSVHLPPRESINTYLWFTSELRGYIEQPDYYLKHTDEQASEALENLLLTQGWRTFSDGINRQPKNTSIAYMPENAGHLITARVTHEGTGKPAVGVLVYLSVPGRRIQLYGCISNEAGIVHFDMKDFYGPSQIILQTSPLSGTAFHLEIFSPFSEQYEKTSLPTLQIKEQNSGDLEAASLHVKVQEAYHENNLRTLITPLIDTLPFYVKPYKTYLLDNYTRFTTMEEVMREYVMEVNVRRKDKKFHFETFNAAGAALRALQPSEDVFIEDPLVLLDGVPVFNIDKIMAYDPLKVQKLEVVASRYYWGPIKANGIVSYTTFKGNLEGYTLDPGDLIVDYEGLQKSRKFFAPEYTTQKEIQGRLPDFRDLLYWSPEVQTNDKGEGSVSFYTGDLTGKFLVDLQGISPSGEAGSQQVILEVKK